MAEVDELREAVEREYPRYDERAGDWDEVLRRAATAPRWRSSWPLRGAIAAGAIASVALVLLAPWKSESGLVDRALAAIGKGRIVHVVVRVNPQGTAIDLASGRRARIYVDIEQWYEPGVGLRQKVLRSNGSLEPGSLPFMPRVSAQYAQALRGFTTGYRTALRHGDAYVAGKATLFARPVHWIRFRKGAAKAGVEVAIDASTYRPLYVRETTDGRVTPGSGSQILAIDTSTPIPNSLPPEPEPNDPPTMFGIERTGRLTLEKAASSLRGSALWLGRNHAGLPLAWVGGLEYSQGRVKHWSQIKQRWHGLELVYGDIDNFGFPVRTRPYIRIEEQTQPGASPGGFVPEGTLVSYGRWGLARKAGLYVYIVAPNEELLLGAAKALLPIRSSAGSGAGG
jgi:hypothetical protein